MPKKGTKPKKPRKGKVGEPPKVYEQAAPDWRAALADFASGLKDLYGARLDRLILYGSRARGDAEPLSDVDTLVVLTDCPDFWADFHRIAPLADRVSLDHGIVISALPTSVREIEESQSSLFMNVRREGKQVA